MSTATLNNQSKAVVHRWSQTLIPTTREAPSDAVMPSHIFMTRAGYIRPVGSGIYNYLPLAWRSLQKISAIIREELDAAGASEMLMPALMPMELYKDTKRDQNYGDLLFQLEDRHGRATALGPTHEEVQWNSTRTPNATKTTAISSSNSKTATDAKQPSAQPTRKSSPTSCAAA